MKLKIVFIYLVVVLSLSFYIWIKLFKEGNRNQNEIDNVRKQIGGYNTEYDNEILTSNAVTPGITSIDRYSDPMCNTANNEYIYCVDGQIECNDIFGSNINGLTAVGDPYTSGSTLGGCGSYIKKVNLNEYVSDYGGANYTRGVYFDISRCNPDTPWRVGGETKKKSVGDIKDLSFVGCFKSQIDADNIWDICTNQLNSHFNLNDNVLVSAYYLTNIVPQQRGLQELLAVIDSDKTKNAYMIIKQQKYYKAIIKSINGNNYTIQLNYPNGQNINIDVTNNYLLKDSLYNKITNDYYSDLKTGSHPRPVCKSGKFTSCLKSPPFTIHNGLYVSTSDPILSVDASYNIHRNKDLQSIAGPYITPPINPSAPKFGDNNLLEYNYYKNQPNETPFIKCIANYGTNVGDNVCCGQNDTLNNTNFVCPQEVPKCLGYSKDDNTYGYCT